MPYCSFRTFIARWLLENLVLDSEFYKESKSENQGEAMGVTLGIRTLGGSIMGFSGGFLTAISPEAPTIVNIFAGCIVSIILFKKKSYLSPTNE